MAAVPSGSYLVISHATPDFDAGSTAQAQAQQEWNEESASPLVPRTRAELLRFSDGMEILDPGVVSMSRWRPEDTDPADVPGYGAVARKV